ncbi:alpha-tubulin N-acetyltransferase 2-like [Drosophila bipectinata]|uniref:alpha-tubulin N-acetyltransferase 2-like n=1 Tax=Drosophila bipectinata TaxID=42026 RepID=UPI001C89C5A2|nr:alpha-tubulin N-acetyltransferase 2-like [Drosophila bipectinata]
MVEFEFDIKDLFPQEIIRVQPDLLRPQTPTALLKRQNRQGAEPPTPACKLNRIIDEMGQLSAVAQGLRIPVTTAEKMLANTNTQVTYLMADDKSGRWAVTGLLKVGTKNLYLFDEKGACRRANQTPAILDFYIHESRQRRGLGKRIFDKMLADQGWSPCKVSVDRPSPKMIGFLGKHFGLVRTITQGNRFVVYDGFFDDLDSQGQKNEGACGSGVSVACAGPIASMPCRGRVANPPDTFNIQILDDRNKNSNANKNVSPPPPKTTNNFVKNSQFPNNDSKTTQNNKTNTNINSNKSISNPINTNTNTSNNTCTKGSGSNPTTESSQTPIQNRNQMCEGSETSSAVPQNQPGRRYPFQTEMQPHGPDHGTGL